MRRKPWTCRVTQKNINFPEIRCPFSTTELLQFRSLILQIRGLFSTTEILDTYLPEKDSIYLDANAYTSVTYK